MDDEQTVRVAVYDRAMTMYRLLARAPSVEAIAETFLNFVQGQRWRIDALDVAIKHTGRGNTIETLVQKAEQIAKWAVPKPESAPVVKPTKKKAPKKKS